MFRRLFFIAVLSIPAICSGQTVTDDAHALGVKGIALVDAGHHEEGIRLLKKARNLHPQEYDYTLEIGKAYLLSGDPRKAERYLYDLQYHVDVRPDLYLRLADCYAALNGMRKKPDPERKRELQTLRYGLGKLSDAGVLYLRLGKLHLETEKPLHALAIWEKGVLRAPNFAENYYWSARMLDMVDNSLWAWVYGEVFLNMSDDNDLKRSIAPTVYRNAQRVLWSDRASDPDAVTQELARICREHCGSLTAEDHCIRDQVSMRSCLLSKWKNPSSGISPLFRHMQNVAQRGWLEAYVASLFREAEKENFLEWLAENAATYERFSKWNTWNRLTLTGPIQRLQ